jgi:dipeptidyl aminopeptidase/acylaminoacyl peptidase
MKPFLLCSLLACWLALPAQGQKKKPAPVPKKPLTHDVYDRWKVVDEPQLANDGSWAAYAINPQEGDGKLLLQNLKTPRLDSVPRGYGARLTEDATHAIFKIKPKLEETKAAKRKKKKADELPKDSLGLYDLATNRLAKLSDVKSFKIPERAGGWVAWLAEPEAPKKPEAKKDGPAKPDTAKAVVPTPVKPKKAPKKESTENGTKLTLRNLRTGKDEVFGFVTDYAFAKFGKTLAFISTGNDSTLLAGAYVYDLERGQLRPLVRGKGKYKNLALAEDGSQVALVADRDTTKAQLRKYELRHWRSGQDSARVLADSASAFKLQGWLVSEHTAPFFAKDGSKLYFATAPRPLFADTTKLPEEVVNVEVWNWQDGYIYPQQNRQLDEEKKRGYWAVAHLADQKLVQLAGPDLPTLVPGNEGNANVALGLSNLPYRRTSTWGETATDVYLVDLRTGQRQRVAQKLDGQARLSPGAKYVYWFDNADSAWHAYSVATQQRVKLSDHKTAKFYDELNDMPDSPSDYGVAGWATGDAGLLLYDRYDLWSFDPENRRAPVRLTQGREKTTRYRYVRLDPEERFIDPAKPLLLEVFDEKTRYDGFASLDIRQGNRLALLTAQPASFGYPRKARNTNDVLLTRETFQDFPDLHHTDLTFQNFRRLTTANPQQANYLWGTVELVSWTSFTGETLEGLLYKPENFDPAKQYPMITYFYERLSETLYRHITPAPTPSTVRPSEYTSRGYLVFIPDIPYTIGYPGPSAYDAIVSGVHSLLAKGYVDKAKLGLQGQSWGGYQTLYLITQTKLFSAAMAGAPVANMFSAYGGIRWGTGLSRQFQYERTQSRIGGTIWEKPLLYMQNSPLFQADRIQTPLLMMHNDQDGAVPWYQGIETFMALRRLQKPVWMLNYNGEDHNLIQRKNRKDLSQRMQQFFDHYLLGAPAPVWMSQGVPATEKGINYGFELEEKPAEAKPQPGSGN